MPYDASKNVNQNARPTNYVPAVKESRPDSDLIKPDFSASSLPAAQGSVTAMNQLLISNEQMAREVSVVQAQVFMAKTFPRDREAAMTRIEGECKRITLAEKAAYRYQRGGTDIHGASIDLLRAISQNWGNLESGFKVLERVKGNEYVPGHSKILAYAIDYETNVRKAREFTVSHVRSNGKCLTDDRDIYELEANNASRRERACLEAIIPTDVVDWALNLCEKTSIDYHQKNMDIGKMVNSFRAEFGVSQAQIEQFAGRKIQAIDIVIYIKLRDIFKALKDGVAKVSDFFKPVEEEPVAEVSETPVKEARTRRKQSTSTPPAGASSSPPMPAKETAPEPEAQTEIEPPSPSTSSLDTEEPAGNENGELTEEEYKTLFSNERSEAYLDDDLEDEGDY